MKNIIKVSAIVGAIIFVALVFGVLTFIPGISDSVTGTVLAPTVTNALGYDGCCDSGSSGGRDDYGSGGSTYTPPSPPSCTLKATPATINAGDDVTLTWTSQNSKVNHLPPHGKVTKNGTKVIQNVTATKTFTLVVDGTNGQRIECTDKVVVKPKPQPAPTCTLTVSDGSITPNRNVTLSWNTTNATDVSISSLGAVALDGSRTVSPNQTITYTLIARGQGGNITCQRTVLVVPAPKPAPTCELQVKPGTINYNDDVNIHWSTTHADSVTLSGFGDVEKNGSRMDQNLKQDKTYTLTVTGNGKSVTCKGSVNVKAQPSPKKPSCTITANPASIQNGGSSTLVWSSENATSASINQGIGNVALDGSKGVSPNQTKTYTMTVKGSGGTANCQTVVTVTVTPNAPSCTISANPSSIQKGNSSTLSWTSHNATDAAIDGIGDVTLNGSRSVSPDSTETYTLTVFGPGGTANCQTTVVVTQITHGAPSCSIWADDTTIEEGDETTLRWNSNNATSASINQGIGSVDLDGEEDVSPNNTTTYTLTVNGPGGVANCQTTIVVEEEPEENDLSCEIDADPSNIDRGESSYLTWESDKAVNAFLTQIGNVGVNGNYTVYPYTTTTYILTVYDNRGHTENCQTTVQVDNITYNQPPSCWITLTPQYNSYNNLQATLSWGSYNATSAYINPSIGSVSTHGSRTVYTDGYVQYTMTVYGQGGTATCQTTSTYVPPPTITLTQIPYTGVGGSILYWSSILLFALSLAYLAVYYVPMFAGIKRRLPEPVMEAPMQFAKSVAAAMPIIRKDAASTSHWMTKDAMSLVASQNGSAPRIVIARS